MNTTRAYGGYPLEATTVDEDIVPMQEQQDGDNTDVIVLDDIVIKTSRACLSEYDAVWAARHLEHYARDLSNEPIRVASIQNVVTVPDRVRPEMFHVAHTVERIQGPNLAQLRGEWLRSAVREINWSIHNMRHVDGDPNKLQSGVDTTARNFIIAVGASPVHSNAIARDSNGKPLKRLGTPVLIDHNPAYRRFADGRFHVGRDAEEEDYIESAYGTKSGAMANNIFTSLYLTKPSPNLATFDDAAFYEEWKDLVPPSMQEMVREDLKRQVAQHKRWLAQVALRSMVRVPR